MLRSLLTATSSMAELYAGGLLLLLAVCKLSPGPALPEAPAVAAAKVSMLTFSFEFFRNCVLRKFRLV